jgi:hypothetical protein
MVAFVGSETRQKQKREIMFFQETIPDTSGYMIAGYAITFIILGIYVASMYLRSRNYKQDMTVLEEMDKAAAVKPEKPAKAVTKKRAKN